MNAKQAYKKTWLRNLEIHQDRIEFYEGEIKEAIEKGRNNIEYLDITEDRFIADYFEDLGYEVYDRWSGWSSGYSFQISWGSK